MPSLEKKFVSGMLALIRARRKKSPIKGDDISGIRTSAVVPAKIREAKFSDFEGVATLKHCWGLAPDSPENWERLWQHNPATRYMGSERPIGWVLEADGKIVGYLGNIPQLYRYGGKTLTAVTAHGLVVDPSYRALSASLVAAYFQQKSVDLYISTTAIEAVGKIARAFKSDPLPQAEYHTVFFWVIRPYSFSRSLMMKLGLNTVLRTLCSGFLSVAIAVEKIFERRWPRKSPSRLSVNETNVDGIDREFDDLWLQKVSEEQRLLADRTSETLKWHFGIPSDRGDTSVLRCSVNGKLLGYAVVRHEPEDQTKGLKKSSIDDMLIANDDREVVGALILAAYGCARKAGSHTLEVMGFPQNLRAVFRSGHPYSRQYPACPYHYKAADPALHQQLSKADQWYATPFDGDASLIRPSYPISPPRVTLREQMEFDRNQVAEDVAVSERTEVV